MADSPIKVRADAKEMIEELCDESGVSQVELLTRMVRWVYAQDDRMRGLILAKTPTAVQVDTVDLIRQQMKKAVASSGAPRPAKSRKQNQQHAKSG
jgi:hypothetical protein